MIQQSLIKFNKINILIKNSIKIKIKLKIKNILIKLTINTFRILVKNLVIHFLI
jgi:hypothetical protein